MCKYLFLFAFLINPLFASQYCILKLEKLSDRAIKINQACNGTSKMLFLNTGAIDHRFSKISSLLGSYPLEEIDNKVESFTLSVFLRDGFTLKKSRYSDHKKTFILIK